jgi:hypothetical protein
MASHKLAGSSKREDNRCESRRFCKRETSLPLLLLSFRPQDSVYHERPSEIQAEDGIERKAGTAFPEFARSCHPWGRSDAEGSRSIALPRGEMLIQERSRSTNLLLISTFQIKM